jgi:hypothetical protein
MFVYKTGAPLKARLLASPTNIRLGWKAMEGTNTSLLHKSVNYGCKQFYSMGFWDVTKKKYKFLMQGS